MILEAEKAWKGQLPGAVTVIQTNPLRCEFAGKPPHRILAALGLKHFDSTVPRFWSLYLHDRIAGIYLGLNGIIPFPALPKGTAICTREGAGRILLNYDNPNRPISYRLYIQELRPGIVGDHFTGLEVSRPDEEEMESYYYGLDYKDDLEVTNINLYVEDVERSFLKTRTRAKVVNALRKAVDL